MCPRQWCHERNKSSTARVNPVITSGWSSFVEYSFSLLFVDFIVSHIVIFQSSGGAGCSACL